jgi:hypothetical protein
MRHSGAIRTGVSARLLSAARTILVQNCLTRSATKSGSSGQTASRSLRLLNATGFIRRRFTPSAQARVESDIIVCRDRQGICVGLDYNPWTSPPKRNSKTSNEISCVTWTTCPWLKLPIVQRSTSCTCSPWPNSSRTKTKNFAAKLRNKNEARRTTLSP